MPARNPITVTVNATPQVFGPTGEDSNGVSSFRNRALASLRLQPTFTVSMDEPKLGGRKSTKGTLKVIVPKSKTVNGVETIFNRLVKVEVVADEDDAEVDRVFIRELVIALLGHADIKAAFDKPERFW